MPLISDFLSQVIARMGPSWIDTRAERAFWKTVRVFARRRRPLVLLGLLAVPQVASTQMAVVDGFNLKNNVYQFTAQGIRDRVAQLWKEGQDQARWVTDLVESYRAVKMARASYESLATFDLSQNVNVVDLVPQIDLPAGEYFGADDAPHQDANGNDHYVSLRFKLNPVGGISQTLNFSTLSKFQPKLRINVDQLSQQLANLDFDALQMVQYRGPNGEMRGTPINVGKSVAARFGLWDKVLGEANDWAGQAVKEQQTYQDLQQQQAYEAQYFTSNLLDLKTRADKEDADLRARLQGKDVTADIPSTYDQVYSPRVQLARQMLAAQQMAEKLELKQYWDKITNLKRTEEKRQAAVQGDAQVTEVLAQAAKIQQDMQTGFIKILDKYKVQRQDQGEKVGGLTLSTDDLQNMKLPPQARDEVNRMMAAGTQALQVLQLKLQGQKYMADHLATIDGVTKDLTDATNELATAYQNSSDSAVANLQSTLASLDKQRLANYDALQNQIRADAAARAAAASESLANANQKFFGYMLTKKPISGAALAENLVKAYVDLFRTFTTGRSLGDVMGPRFTGARSDYQAEQDLYNSF